MFQTIGKYKSKSYRKIVKPVDIGYPEQQKMLELIKRNYWQPGIKNDIKKYVQGYIKCQQYKVQHMKKVGELHLLEIPEISWQEISIDIIEPLSKSNELDTIVVIVDQFIKIIRLKATIIAVLSEDIAKIYKDKIQKLHRVPQKVLSNREPQFTLKFMEDLTKILETKQKYYLQHTTLKLMDKQSELTKKVKYSYDIM